MNKRKVFGVCTFVFTLAIFLITSELRYEMRESEWALIALLMFFGLRDIVLSSSGVKRNDIR